MKRSLHCKSESSDVHDPKKRRHLAAISTSRKWSRSGCSRSIANLKDIIHGSKRHIEQQPSCSPRSIGSSEFLNPITHVVILGGNSKCELKITSFSGGGQQDFSLAPGAPMHCFNNPSFRVSSNTTNGGGALRRGSPPRSSGCSTGKGTSIIIRRRSWLGGSGVTELVEGDSLRKIVEIICKRGWVKSEPNTTRIERVLKVHNMQKTLARFEEYRETVKIKASELSKKHPRCLADGNELLRFYGTTLSCSLGLNGSSTLCVSEKCCVCQIVRNRLSARKELKDGIGVFTTSTNGRAFESIEIVLEDLQQIRTTLIVCRVITGRVQGPSCLALWSDLQADAGAGLWGCQFPEFPLAASTDI
ncbi:hypothetical protein SAY87_007613 [Trapa incisa]|uniref:Uncharacterized protein n=1 Tax=Trapa incisa TaxID=236973 RepID=A0AAN7KFC0_9MYRT|nr:hypothetical protein SAY87_007613 [Trapa incisa]